MSTWEDIKFDEIAPEFNLNDSVVKDELQCVLKKIRLYIQSIDVEIYETTDIEKRNNLKLKKEKHLLLEKSIITNYQTTFSDSIYIDYFSAVFELEKQIEIESNKEDVNRGYLKTLKQKRHFLHHRSIEQIRWAIELPLFYNEFKKNDVSDKYKKIKLIIQYYDEDSLERRIEIIKSIQNNIDSNHFSEIVMFIETRKNRSYEELCSDFKNTNKVRFIETESRITFEMAFDISKKDNDTESVYLLTNNDCYFDDTVNLLKKVNYENGSVLVCMTRKDYTEIGDIDYAVEPGITKPEYEFNSTDLIPRPKCQRLSIASQDAWAFTSNFKNDFDTKIEMGTFNCEHFLCANAFEKNIKLRNVVSFINCIHLHLTQFRREYAFDNKVTSTRLNNMWPNDDNPRTEDNVINATWRLRTSENYIDKMQNIQNYSDYHVNNFKNICKETLK